MNHDNYPDAYIRDILLNSRVFAMVGASAKITRPSYFVLKYLVAKGFDAIPINPGLAGKTIADRTVFASLTAIERAIDVVDIFRRPEFTVDVVRGIAKRAQITGQHPVVWTQIGVSSDEAAALASEAGLPYVKDTCTMAVHRRLAMAALE